LGEHLSVNRVGYAEASADGEFVNITTAYVQGLAEVSGQHRLEDYGPEMLAQFRSGRTIAFDDVANDPRLTEPQKSAHELLEARANLNVPLLRAGQLRAVLFVHSKVRRVWTAGEVTLLEQVAARTWDAVERARAELTLARRAAELEAILASMPDALYIGDHTGIHRANQLALDQLGFKTFEELVADIAHLGERIQTRDLKTGKRFRPEEEPFVRALHGESVAHEVAITHLITGDEVIVRCSARPIRLEGRIIGAVAINTDITAEKRAEEALARQAKELARSNDDLHQFAHVAAHDLQAPLRMVRSYAQLLQRRFHGRLDAAADGYIDMIMDGVETMQQLTEGLLNLAQAGEALGEYADIRIETVIDGALTNLQPMIHETGAEVTCGELPTVYADRLQMLQLFQNLIGNALKYRDPQRHPRIRITAETRDRTHSFAVADNGIGIDQIHYQDIFAPLKRLHGKNIPGTGIGLAVCKKIIERHGGRIWVDSQPGDGSVFHFTLPVN
jgi:signal transduction histidine kinase